MRGANEMPRIDAFNSIRTSPVSDKVKDHGDGKRRRRYQVWKDPIGHVSGPASFARRVSQVSRTSFVIRLQSSIFKKIILPASRNCAAVS